MAVDLASILVKCNLVKNATIDYQRLMHPKCNPICFNFKPNILNFVKTNY